MKLFIFIFLISSNFFPNQKVESIYVLTKNKKYKNHTKNYYERDSLVLYKDSTFRRENISLAFCEINRDVAIGKWNLSKEYLLLKVEKREDSSRTILLSETQIISKNQLKKYKKTQ